MEFSVICPSCRKNDYIQKVSSIVSSGQVSGGVIGPTFDFSDGFFGMGIGAGGFSSQLTRKLTPPLKPDEPFFFYNKQKFNCEVEAWKTQMMIWSRLYYCHRDDIVFDPYFGKYYHPDGLHGYLDLIAKAEQRRLITEIKYKSTELHSTDPANMPGMKKVPFGFLQLLTEYNTKEITGSGDSYSYSIEIRRPQWLFYTGPLDKLQNYYLSTDIQFGNNSGRSCEAGILFGFGTIDNDYYYHKFTIYQFGYFGVHYISRNVQYPVIEYRPSQKLNINRNTNSIGVMGNNGLFTFWANNSLIGIVEIGKSINGSLHLYAANNYNDTYGSVDFSKVSLFTVEVG